MEQSVPTAVPEQSLFSFCLVDDGKWKCNLCSLRWEQKLNQCQACESYKPGLSDGDIAALKAAEEKQTKDTIALFTSSAPPGGNLAIPPLASPVFSFGFGVAHDPPADAGFSFGSGVALPATTNSFGFPPRTEDDCKKPISFGFGAAPSDPIGVANSSVAAVSFGFGSTSASTQGGNPDNPITFGFGTSSSPLTSTVDNFGSGTAAALAEKSLSILPDLSRKEVATADVFVHGSGECDQLGLGDARRERKKPTLVKMLSGKMVCEISVGALHVICRTAPGVLYSWGCNDDGALGRNSEDNSDCEPREIQIPGVCFQSTACGDNHSCALDSHGRVWLWGTYKDSNGHIGIARKRKQAQEKSSEPDIVLEGCTNIASGSNHTIALARQCDSTGVQLYSWGSNATGQLGLKCGTGCGFSEVEIAAADVGRGKNHLTAIPGGGCKVDGKRVARILKPGTVDKSAIANCPQEVEAALASGATALIAEGPEREVPKGEKQRLLWPQEVHLPFVGCDISSVFTSAECTFAIAGSGNEVGVYGCGLNGDGQVGLGFASIAVRTLRALQGCPENLCWIGGGLHFTAALADGKVFSWGKAEECGQGLGQDAPIILEPRAVPGLPTSIRTVHCGGNHTLACSAAGDVYAWGCGLTHQLGNLPRDSSQPAGDDEDPSDELRPYRMSSRQLDTRFVLSADGGAQHSVELAWDGNYTLPAEPLTTAGPTTTESIPSRFRNESSSKRVRTEDSSENGFCKDVAEVLPVPEVQQVQPFSFAVIDDGKWKCDLCSLRWEQTYSQCQACENYRPGLSEEDIAALKAAEVQKTKDTIAMFTSSAQPTGFGTVDTGGGPGSFSFGFASTDAGKAVDSSAGASAASFCFGSPANEDAEKVGDLSAGAATAVSFGFGSSAKDDAAAKKANSFGFGATPAEPAAFAFGFGSALQSSATSAAETFGFRSFGTGVAGCVMEEKSLPSFPDFSLAEVPTADVFVHGSGECDQLGLGDARRERKKPTLVKVLSGKMVCEIAVGALHVICRTAPGVLYSWGCNDDGALGRNSDDNSDCEPREIQVPGVCFKRTACGDNHSCALDSHGRVWLWGTYKDSNGHIGIARKRKQTQEKNFEPEIVLEGCVQIASGANHTVALTEQSDSADAKLYSWGSNATGQLGLECGTGCGLKEVGITAAEVGQSKKPLEAIPGGGCKIDGMRVARITKPGSVDKTAMGSTPQNVEDALFAGATGLVLEGPEREVPKGEKQRLLWPQEVHLPCVSGVISNLFTSAECTFVATGSGDDVAIYGCGLNGDGQVGVGFASMAVTTFKALRGCPPNVCWIGGGLHFTVALAHGNVFSWGKAEECGLGLGQDASIILEPRAVPGLPQSIRTLRCGGRHTLACSAAGDVYVWGCGLTHQLGNLPRDSTQPAGDDEDPSDELRPYRMSSRQLDTRFVLLADGGAQHSVELAWDGSNAKIPEPSTAAGISSTEQPLSHAENEPPSKRIRTENCFDVLCEENAEPVSDNHAGRVVEPLSFIICDGQWKCDLCSLRWEQKKDQCQACGSYKPGLSEEDIAALKAAEAQTTKDTIAMFTSSSPSVQPSGFITAFSVASCPETTSSTGFSFGFGSTPAASPVSSFGCVPAQSQDGEDKPSSHRFGTAHVEPIEVANFSSAPVAFGFCPSVSTQGPSPVIFGFGSTSTEPVGVANDSVAPVAFGFCPSASTQGANSVTFEFGSTAASVPVASTGAAFRFDSTCVATGSSATGDSCAVKEKSLSELPEFSCSKVPTADVFVHGSGECDQLGLGDARRERKKPTLVKTLSGKMVCEISVGALHVICRTAPGVLYSWGCNDDGALGRSSNDNSDCEPREIQVPGVSFQSTACGDNHSCALDSHGRVWLWGTYKDSNGHIGIPRKRKQTQEKSFEPDIVLEGCVQVASGANHTVALTKQFDGNAVKVYSWGSNATGQLGLECGTGCGFDEIVVPAVEVGNGKKLLTAIAGGGCKVDGMRVARVVKPGTADQNAMNSTPNDVLAALAAGATAVILEGPEREVPKGEKQRLLWPHEVNLDAVSGVISRVCTSAECTFVICGSGSDVSVYGSGLNGDGQVGVGFASIAVRTLRALRGHPPNVFWIGGGLHFSALLADGQVFSWGRAEECGQGMGQDAPIILEPRAVPGLPMSIRMLRCGGSHTLACSAAGDVYSWGCGLTYQLGNLPRDSSQPAGADEDPSDELRPYRMSSKQLDPRYVLSAGGGAQHSVELAWDGNYAELLVSAVATNPTAMESPKVRSECEPPRKRVRTETCLEDVPGNEPEPTRLSEERSLFAVEQSVAAVAVARNAAAAAASRRQSRVDAHAREESRLAAQVEASVLKLFSGSLLSEAYVVHGGSSTGRQQSSAPMQRRVIWSPRGTSTETDPLADKVDRPGSDSTDSNTVAAGQCPDAANGLRCRDVGLIPQTQSPRSLRLQAQLACLDRGGLESLLLRVDRGQLFNEGELQAAVRQHLEADQSGDAVSSGR